LRSLATIDICRAREGVWKHAPFLFPRRRIDILENVSRGRGRPCKDKSKRDTVRFRIDDEDEDRMRDLMSKTGLSRSEIMRKALRNLYQIYRFRN
jgi:hypothetical protein